MPMENISSVMEHGILSYYRAAKIQHTSVALQPVQDRRDQKQVPGGLTLHQYANLYFHARNPMMFKRQAEASRLCVLRVSRDVSQLEGAVISDQNAASDYVRFLHPKQWKLLDLDAIYAMDWRHPGDPPAYYRHSSQKCAEILIPNCVEQRFITGAYVVDNAAKKASKASERGYRPPRILCYSFARGQRTMFRALIGDMFASRAQTLVNTVNCVGVMGKGVAEQFKIRFPEMFKDYKLRTDRQLVHLGEPYLYRDLSGSRIINFPTKDHWRSSSRVADIERGLDYLASHYAQWGVTSIAIPPLGCGNGGLEWSEVGPLIYQKLHAIPIDVEVYAPYGTPKHQLTEEFLSSPSQMSLEGKGRRQGPLKPEWVVLLEVLRELEAQPYANPVGRTIFQKISYVMTEMGVPTGFQFGKGSYGPFSGDVKLALHDFATRNWLHEEQFGRMIALRSTAQYDRDRNQFKEQIDRHQKKIDKAVDLFSRIKSTEQAEQVLTVFFAARQLKAGRPGELTEQDLEEYILDWKKSWRTHDKKEALASTIRNLASLEWLQLKLPDPAWMESNEQLGDIAQVGRAQRHPS